MSTTDNSVSHADKKAVRVLLILVTITAVLSLLYAVQYYAGGPIRLAVVSEFYDVVIDPSATRIAAGAQDGKVRLWEVPAQLNTNIGGGFDVAKEPVWPVRILSGHEAPVIAVAFAPDGATLLSVSADGEVRRWAADVSGDSGEVVLEIKKPLAQAAFSVDRSRLAVMGEDGIVQVWSVEGGELVRTFGPTAGGRAVALSDDGTLVAASDGVNVSVWDVASGQPLQEMVGYCKDEAYTTAQACEDAEETWLGHVDEVTALAFSHDNQLLASGSTDTTVVFWNVESGEAEWSSVGHWAAVTSLLFDPEDSLVLSTGADNAIKTLRLPGGKSTGTYVGSLSAVNAGVFGPTDGTITTVSADGTMRVWQTANQYVIHLEWSEYGFEPAWGQAFATWMLISGLLGLLCLWGLWRFRLWSHLLTLAVFLVGPIIVLGVPLMQLYLFGSLQLLASWAVRGAFLLAGLGSAVCLAIVLIRLFQNEGLLGGLLGLVFPPYAFVKGWMRTTEWRTDRVMLTWAGLVVGGMLLGGLVLFSVVPLVPEPGGSVNILDIYPPGVRFQISWPLIVLAAWYIALLVVLTRQPVALFYEAPHAAALAEQLQASQHTLKLRFGIYSFAVWVSLLVLLFSVLRRFNLDVAFMGHYFGFIMQGAWTTLYISALSILGAIVLALLGALGRLSKNPIANGVSGFYISLIRGTPLLVQIFIWYLGLPQLGILLRAEVAGILALSVNYGAYMTEIFRAGIQAISKGQHEAAHALGMSRGQTFRRIVLPQAFRIVIPPIGNEFIAMMKDSSLVYVMGVWELTFRANKIGRQNFRAMETFIIAAAFYWILTVIFQFLQGKLEEYMARGERR